MPTITKTPKPANKSINRIERIKVYNSKRWKKLRLVKLMKDPLCEICLQKGIITPAIDIHHIDSFMNYYGIDRIEKAYNINNLMSICKVCHKKEHSG